MAAELLFAPEVEWDVFEAVLLAHNRVAPLYPRRPLRLIPNADEENRRGRRGRSLLSEYCPSTFPLQALCSLIQCDAAYRY